MQLDLQAVVADFPSSQLFETRERDNQVITGQHWVTLGNTGQHWVTLGNTG